MKSITGVVLAVLLATAGGAAAQSSSPPPPPKPAKSEGVGVGLGVVGTIVPAIGFGVGLSIDDRDTRSKVVLVSLVGGLILPSSGLFYAKQKGSIGYVPRAGAILVLGGAALFDALGEDDEAGKWYAISGALYVIGAGIDIAMTPSAVRDYNRNFAAVTATLTPTVVPGGAGVALAGQF